MKRVNFIKTSLMGIAAVAVTPHKLFMSNNSMQLIELKVNEHIRHGFYGDEFVENILPGGAGIRLRVDRFLNPMGDMELYEMNCSGRTTNLAVQGEQILVDNVFGRHHIQPSPKTVDLNLDSGMCLYRGDLGSIALGDREHLLVLNGEIECDSQIIGPGSCLFSSSLATIQTSGNASILIFSS